MAGDAGPAVDATWTGKGKRMSEEKLVTQVIAELEDALYARLTASLARYRGDQGGEPDRPAQQFVRARAGAIRSKMNGK